jgi:hypothetical protein
MGHEARLRLVTKETPRAEELEQLREFASKVEDEAHWSRLLASAESDESRAELERVLGPLLPFRKPRCHSPSCESGLPPIWQPVLVVRKRPDDAPIWAPIEVRFCETCKKEMGVRDLMTDDIWRQITFQCLSSGEPIPVRLLTQLTFDRIQ